jgi:ribosomal protein S18 acetylase RimI-like enzyme
MKPMKMEKASTDCKVIEMTTEEEAIRITEFFLSPSSFDDQRHTPGELEHFRRNPLESLKQVNHKHWSVENEWGEIIGVTSLRENEHQTGGFLWDYLVVHRSYRNLGIASKMFANLQSFVIAAGGRYILTYTCDMPEYLPVQRMFVQRGFQLIGQYPGYYYDGESRLAFYKKIPQLIAD